MFQSISAAIGASLALMWGIAHLFPTQSVVRGFGEVSSNNRYIITMEWIAEGLSLMFLGLLPLLTLANFALSDPVVPFVIRCCAAMLFLMAALTTVTGSRSSIIPIKICPIVKLVAGCLLIYGTL
jgi:hypothetical protein